MEICVVADRTDHPVLGEMLAQLRTRHRTRLLVPDSYTPLSQAAAVRFRRWLFDNVTAEQVAAQGFRSGSISQQALPPIDRQHGANPDPPAVIPLPLATKDATIELAGLGTSTGAFWVTAGPAGDDTCDVPTAVLSDADPIFAPSAPTNCGPA